MDDELSIEFIRQECAIGHIKWTTHILERMQERNIELSDVLYCINNGMIIEQYPDAYPYPAYLILGIKNNNKYIHVVLGYGIGFVWIITVYEPDENEWTNNFTERKE